MSEQHRPGGVGAGQGGRRVVVLGATGNVGSSTVQALAADPWVDTVLGLARRVPDWQVAKTRWARADIRGGPAAEAELTEHFRGADAVIHLAWLLQPTHDPTVTWQTNVLGTVRVLRAVAAARVPALVYASSVGAYSPGPKDQRVDESWPTHGWPQAAYCREKAYVERLLDVFEHEHPKVRVVRMRPGFIFKRESAMQQRRLFMGPLVPNRLVRPELIPVIPDVPGLRLQILHTEDAAEAYRLAAVGGTAHGPFNLAAEPVVDPEVLARVYGARRLRLPRPSLRAAVSTAWRLRLAPASPELFDAAMRLPVMSTARAVEMLGWTPRHSAEDTLAEFTEGLREGAGMQTPPLAPRVGGGRLGELATGVGQRP